MTWRPLWLCAALAVTACPEDVQPGAVLVGDALSETTTQELTDAATDSGPSSPVDVWVLDGVVEAAADLGNEVATDLLVDGPAGPPGDVGVELPVDAPTTAGLAEALPGLWLIGWSGGLDHYDWLRFGPLDPSGAGSLAWAAPTVEGALTFWTGCDGTSTWSLTATPDTIAIDVPAGCVVSGDDPLVMTFTISLDAAWPELAIAVASIEVHSDQGTIRSGFKYPDDWCDPDLSTCPYPFAEAP